MTHARIIFIPGLNPKPVADIYRQQLTRVLLTGLRAARPRAAEWLAAHPEAFVPVAWTYLFYGAHRDVSADLPGIERLISQNGPSEQDLKELRSWGRRVLRSTHRIGDAWPLLGRRFAPATTRRLLHEANRYLKNRDGVGAAVRNVLREMLEAAWRDGDSVLLIGHSLGSVIAYDTLWELTHVDHSHGKVSMLITLGSPLGTRFVQRSLLSARAEGVGRYPHNISHWVNMSARSDMTALQPRLKPLFHEMLDLNLCDAIEDFVDFDNYFRGAIGLNPHEAYGYFAQPLLGEVIGDWLERFAD